MLEYPPKYHRGFNIVNHHQERDVNTTPRIHSLDNELDAQPTGPTFFSFQANYPAVCARQDYRIRIEFHSEKIQRYRDKHKRE
ncbi:hypothetical protein OPQ81_001413 [Rhizoctonia solani]|nr:hypothetical protein OPQ81_001413 [Rhizoctonia solani]